jgi:DNA-directed RNA polymerase specialized sigma subunit
LVLLGKTSNDDDGDSGAVYEMKKNHNQSQFEPYANILSLRRDKLLNFYSEVQGFSSVEHYIPVKFEDLVQAGTLSLIKDIENKSK